MEGTLLLPSMKPCVAAGGRGRRMGLRAQSGGTGSRGRSGKYHPRHPSDAGRRSDSCGSTTSIRGFVGNCKQIPSLPSELYVSIHLFPCIFNSVLCIYITAEYDAAVPEAEREQLKGGAFEGVLGAAQEAIVISPWVAIVVRPKPGVWEYLRVDVSKLAVEELSVSEYLQFKEQLVEGSTMVGSNKPCELRPPMSAFMCGSFIGRPHNMELIAIFDPVHLEAGAP